MLQWINIVDIDGIETCENMSQITHFEKNIANNYITFISQRNPGHEIFMPPPVGAGNTTSEAFKKILDQVKKKKSLIEYKKIWEI